MNAIASTKSYTRTTRDAVSAGPPLKGSKGAQSKRHARSIAPTVASTLYVTLLLAVLATAYVWREEEYIIPGHGTGYWLGIAGGVIMLVLLLYPLRKKRAKEVKYGSVATWFQWHMILGVLGPTLVILHSNFELKSVNATVATAIMLVVVVSGVIGRFLYRKVHKGLYDAKAEVSALLFDADALYDAFGEDMQNASGIMDKLKSFESRVLVPHTNPFQSLGFIISLAFQTRSCRRAIRAEARAVLDQRAQNEGWSKQQRRDNLSAVLGHVDDYFATVRKAAELKFYNRLFGLWHVLHLPLFLLLIAAAVVHIVAVHLY